MRPLMDFPTLPGGLLGPEPHPEMSPLFATTQPHQLPKLGFWPPDPAGNDMRRSLRGEGLIPDPERNFRMPRMRPPEPFDMEPWNRLLEQEYDRMFRGIPREQIPPDLRRPLEIFDWPDDGMPVTLR